MTYQEAQQLHARARNKGIGKKLAKATYLRKVGDNFVIRYHFTDVVTITPENEYILNSGGWYTKTTKDRMVTYAPVNVYQKQYQWFVGVTPFRDFIKVDRYGIPKT